ncbi:4649_t:CDS:1, partial [Funneliformis caledonium]
MRQQKVWDLSQEVERIVLGVVNDIFVFDVVHRDISLPSTSRGRNVKGKKIW